MNGICRRYWQALEQAFWNEQFSMRLAACTVSASQTLSEEIYGGSMQLKSTESWLACSLEIGFQRVPLQRSSCARPLDSVTPYPWPIFRPKSDSPTVGRKPSRST